MAWPCPGAAFPQPASFSATLQMLQTPKPGSAGGAGLCPRRPQRRPPRPVIPGSTPGRPHMPAAARAPLGLHEGADVCALGGPSPHEQRALPAPWRGLFPGSHTWSSRPLSRSLLSRVPLDTRVQPLPSEGQGCVLPARSCCCTPWVDLWGAPLLSLAPGLCPGSASWWPAQAAVPRSSPSLPVGGQAVASVSEAAVPWIPQAEVASGGGSADLWTHQ